eukprot:88617-Pyramimonas_sp.AAC.1
MLPFDVFEKSFANTDDAHHSLDIYADDITIQVAATSQDIVYQTVPGHSAGPSPWVSALQNPGGARHGSERRTQTEL